MSHPEIQKRIDELRKVTVEDPTFIMRETQHWASFILAHAYIELAVLVTCTTTGYSVEAPKYLWIGKNARELVKDLQTQFRNCPRRNKPLPLN